MIDNRMVEQARNADIITFLEQRRGFAFVERGGAFRCREHESLAVKADRLSWYWHSRGVGGFGALDFLIKAKNMPFREAVEAVTGIAPAAPPSRPAETPPPKALVLPEKCGIPLRLLDYLCVKRGIDAGIVNALVGQNKLFQDKRGNVVFVGYDDRGVARFASLRGTGGNFRVDCAGSDKRYGFHMGDAAASGRLYVFESPIDAMSHATLVKADTGAWKQDSRLSLAGTGDAALLFFLNQRPFVRELVFCLDNDAPGREAAVQLARKYAQMGLQTRIQLPQGKDFNEDLQAHLRQIRAERRTQSLHRGDVTI